MMKRIVPLFAPILAAAAFAAISGAGAARAAIMTDGVVSEADLVHNRLVLTDGETFKLGTGLGASRYAAGDHVRITWSGLDDIGYPLAYAVVKTDGAAGRSSMNETSTPDNGQSSTGAAAPARGPDPGWRTYKEGTDRIR